MNGNTNFMRFPIFSKLVKLNVGIPNINDNILPSRFFDQPKLDIINLEHNEITEFPYQFSKLPRVEHLFTYLYYIFIKYNKIINFLKNSEIGKNKVEDIINIPSKLQVLYLFENPIKKIPDEVPGLVDLNFLDLNSTEITELPPDIFKLPNLRNLYVSNNPQLSTRIINFGNKNIKECSFEGTNVLCYQENTCANINTKLFTSCTTKEIEEIKSKQSKTPVKSKNKSSNVSDSSGDDNSNIKYLIIGGIVVTIILAILGFIIVRKKRIDDNESKDDDKNYDIVVTEKIRKI
ncbi:L domain-like protein [Neocallimastix californiae]|uniref:L domain-like protein n=1 Tax=Neocallimastix californiae TaxID=1754190 RepID=A0A1Y2FCM7_9FUNG|nr:L domain-like protein [Neocallimastix californiae]|eukprot:ORY81066.1 L domain-like protein [Neocallimastix californiae]